MFRVFGSSLLSNYYIVWHKSITKCDSYYKVQSTVITKGITKYEKKLLQSVTFNTKWEVTKGITYKPTSNTLEKCLGSNLLLVKLHLLFRKCKRHAKKETHASIFPINFMTCFRKDDFMTRANKKGDIK